MPPDTVRIDGLNFVIASEAIPDQGEDSHTAQTDVLGGVLCVADGCGGIGSRRYEKLDGHTEAYMASRLVTQTTQAWVAAMDGKALPATAAEAQIYATELAQTLCRKLTTFHEQHRNTCGAHVIMRGLQRTLPSTLCAALIDAREPDRLSTVFFWAGDSRGYMLTPNGLMQCTADHVSGHADAMENLYRDARLSNMVNADGDFHIDAFGLTLPKPCVVITATDGSFGYLPTPMEFELLLLTTLEASADLESWQRKLSKALGRYASDDSTLALAFFGVESFSQLRDEFAARRAQLQARYITPVRRRKQSIDYARGLWEEYRQTYERYEEVRNADWRLSMRNSP